MENEEDLNYDHRISKSLLNDLAQAALMKKAIWIYIILLIFEGALRKWVLPGLATPLLVVRDPVAIWLLYTAWKNGIFPVNKYVWAIVVTTLVSILTTITIGHGNLIVAIYGARIFLFHFPLIFLIGNIFDREDVVKVGKFILIVAIPMAFLIALQFYSPQSSFINRGIGGDAKGGGFSGALGYFRPPGTFSFTTGNTQFFGIVSVFVVYFWLNPSTINRLLLIGATISLMAAIPLSISRSLFFQVGISILFAMASIVRKPQYIGRMIIAGIGLLVILTLLSRLSFFSNATEALTSRFETASESEGDLESTFSRRILAGLYEPFETVGMPFFGYGLGMGTNAGAQLLVGRSDEFLISEGEWGRLIGEVGFIFGLILIAYRVALSFEFTYESYKKMVAGDLLSWMLLSITFQAIAQGQWAQPTALGFATVFGGLLIAALKNMESYE